MALEGKDISMGLAVLAGVCGYSWLVALLFAGFPVLIAVGQGWLVAMLVMGLPIAFGYIESMPNRFAKHASK